VIIDYFFFDENLNCMSFHSLYVGASNSRVTGITIAHPPAQSLNMRFTTYDPDIATDAKWVKIISWRANGDGSSFVLSHIGSDSINSHPLIVEDCTVIYSRSHFAKGYLII